MRPLNATPGCTCVLGSQATAPVTYVLRSRAKC